MIKELKPTFMSEDGSMLLNEDIKDKIERIPLNEGKETLQEIQLDCTIEEYMKEYNCISMEDFNKEIDKL